MRCLGFSLSAWPTTPGSKVVACYFTNWAQYRSGMGLFQVSDIDPFLCTDIIYAFAGIDTSSLQLTTTQWNDLRK